MSKSLARRIANRLLHSVARSVPGATSLRAALHRARGVLVGKGVFIGEDVYIDNEYPECVEIHDGAQISLRAIIIAHTRGPGRVIIEKDAFVGPNCTLVCGAGRVLRIGTGAVLGAGCVITKSVPPRLYVAAATPSPVARVGTPLPTASTMEEFWAGLTPLKPRAPSPPASEDDKGLP